MVLGYENKRVATLSEGAENYIVIGGLCEPTITDFTVFEGGKIYGYVADRDVNWSRKQKTFKDGMIKENEQYELVCGD